ncbi:MAG: ABC transporter permease [Candidatus Faecivicinus sp.]|nr:ABC transporter permease [Candidatus Faecivicinus sp.]
MQGRKSRWSPVFLTLVLILMYLPIAVVALYSFNANASRYPSAFTGFSLQYYQALLRDTKGLLAALKNSLILAGISCGVAMMIGTLGAVGMAARKFRLQGAIETMAVLPIMVPEIILGMAFLAVFTFAGLRFGMLTLVLAHVTFCTPYVFIIVKGRLAGLDPSLIEASRDLGASPVRAFFTVTLPLILPGVLSGVMLAFAMSLDDFVISFFVTGATTTTLPLKVYSSVKTGVSLQVNALCTLTLAAVAIAMAVKHFALDRRK